ncbi:MAG: alpha/beta hydrolase [Steroidobacteraceae bacterium]
MNKSSTLPVAMICAGLAVALITGCSVTNPAPDKVEVDRSVFFSGGRYVGEKGKEVMRGAMYVEHLRPSKITRKYPLLLIHGGMQTAAGWLTTPDGRKGWAQYFAEQGYDVYMVDQPARGRSAWHPGLDGKLMIAPVSVVEKMFTDPEELGDWPRARRHNQWPGTGRRGDPVSDQFYASQVEFLASAAETQTLVQAAGTALLDRIGPSVVLTHSQSGPFGWLLADARPDLVKGIVAIEPNGPPLQASPELGAGKQLPWGVSDIPITYFPSVQDANDLQVVQQVTPDRPGLLACWQQQEPARQLVNLKHIPILILTTEASYHTRYDHCTANWLRQAGVANDAVRLEDVGIKGNGHMVMLEKNNLDVAHWIDDWIWRNVH